MALCSMGGASRAHSSGEFGRFRIKFPLPFSKRLTASFVNLSHSPSLQNMAIKYISSDYLEQYRYTYKCRYLILLSRQGKVVCIFASSFKHRRLNLFLSA